jgi:hypothetical protein
MNPKTFIMTKEIRAMRTKKLRHNKSLRDHRLARPLIPGLAGQVRNGEAREG